MKHKHHWIRCGAESQGEDFVEFYRCPGCGGKKSRRMKDD